VKTAGTSHGTGPLGKRRGGAGGLHRYRSSPEIHPGVEARHLVGVAIERERGSASVPDPPLGRLAPARVVHLGFTFSRRSLYSPGAARFQLVLGWSR